MVITRLQSEVLVFVANQVEKREYRQLYKVYDFRRNSQVVGVITKSMNLDYTQLEMLQNVQRIYQNCNVSRHIFNQISFDSQKNIFCLGDSLPKIQKFQGGKIELGVNPEDLRYLPRLPLPGQALPDPWLPKDVYNKELIEIYLCGLMHEIMERTFYFLIGMALINLFKFLALLSQKIYKKFQNRNNKSSGKKGFPEKPSRNSPEFDDYQNTIDY
jgi:hypothetical protein